MRTRASFFTYDQHDVQASLALLTRYHSHTFDNTCKEIYSKGITGTLRRSLQEEWGEKRKRKIDTTADAESGSRRRMQSQVHGLLRDRACLGFKRSD